MGNNNWEFTMSESVLKTERMLNKIRLSVPSLEISKTLQAAMPVSVFKMQGITDQLSIPALEIRNSLRAALPEYYYNGISAALRESTAAFRYFPKIAFPTEALRELSETMQILPKIEVSGFAQTILSQLDTSAYATLKEPDAIVSLATADWAWLSDGYNKEDEAEKETEVVSAEITEEIVTQEVRAEIREDIAKVLTNPEQAKEISHSNYVKWKERRPLLADLYMQVFLPFIASILFWLFASGIEAATASAIKNARVYDEPSSSANVVCNITVNQNISIIGEVPYYYVVELPASDTGEETVGYVYKGNLTIEEPQMPEEATAEDSVKTEAAAEETEGMGEPEVTAETTEPQEKVSE